MNELNNRKPAGRPTGGADIRKKRGGAPQNKRPAQSQGNGWAYPQNGGYTQMPLRPVGQMPRSPQPRPAAQTQRPMQPRPAAQTQRPMQPRPAAQTQRPMHPRPAAQIQRPMQPRPAAQTQRPMQPRPAAQAQRPMQSRQPQKQPPRRAPHQNQWIVPEGSAVYTAEGRMYEAPRPDQRRVQNGRPQRPPEMPRRPDPKKKRVNKQRFLLHVKTFFTRLLVMLLIVSILGLWWYRAEFFSDESSRRGTVSFVLDGDRAYEVKAAKAYRGDVLYVDFSEIARWFGMVSVGSVNSMRFICTDGISETSSGKGGEEYAIFVSSSNTVLINGSSISMESVCRTVDSHIWVPLSFVENYIVGVVCDRGAKGTDITFAPEGVDMESLDKDEKIVIKASFKVKAQNSIAPVEYPEEEGDQNE